MRRSKSRPRVSFGHIRRVVRAASGTILAKRFVFDDLTIPDVTSANFDNALTVDLLECVETMDEEVETNGTAIADVPLYSRLMSIKGQILVLGTSGSANVVRWMIYKKPDGEAIAGTDLSDSAGLWHSSNDTPTAREVRKMTLAKGILITNPSSATARVPTFIKRKTLARLGSMREGDKICLLLAKDATAISCKLNGFGTMYVRANG